MPVFRKGPHDAEYRLRKPQPAEAAVVPSLREIVLGVDPGMNGGLACISLDGVEIAAMPQTERATWDWFRWYAERKDVFAYVERIQPAIFAINKASMAKLYGSYMRVRAFLVAAYIPFEAVDAKDWQHALGIPRRQPKETDSKWKGRLKAKAEELFPRVLVTLNTCDALLIAEYGRRTRLGAGHA